jgi:hypothetical protein
MYADAIKSAYQHLIRPISVVPGKEGMLTIGDLHFRELHEGQLKSWYSMRLDHLTSFAGGMLGELLFRLSAHSLELTPRSWLA